MIVVVILMNIIFGIIIDTYAEMDEANATIKDDIENNCLICSMSRSSMEADGVSFDQHTEFDHNWEDYLFFMVHLKNKDESDYNGLELYINEKAAEDSTIFMPLKMSIAFSETEEEDEEKSE